ncbi:VCBS repeat-containing protein [candidate division WOR-3 bacterium]|nr:VCBS repeat-containing protein [candidate division WOR-3 bacterium]
MNLTLMLLLVGALEWTETTAEDFLSNLGHDPMMYISQRANLEAVEGCVEFFARFDIDNNGYYDVLASDGTRGYLRLYKGSASGFNASDSIYYPIPGEGGGCDLADLSLDGWGELIHSGYSARRVTIYWNDGSNGPNPDDSTTLTCPGNADPETVYVYDLDKDTYLDIIAADAGTGRIIVFWGFPTGNPARPVGYSSASVTSFTQGGGEHNIEIGDINKDGWGDIVAGADNTSQNIHLYYWGENRMPDQVVNLLGAGGSNHGVSMADLNGDEWLDLIFTLSYAGGGQNAIVYFYDPETEGYPPSSSVLLTPGSCYGGSAVWDWGNKKGVPGPDGLLDIIFFRADPNNRRPPVVYYNQGVDPYFWESDSTIDDLGNSDIVCSGGFMADFNYDGFWDIYLNAYRGHSASYILYGPNYLIEEADSVPVNEDHHGVFREPGNIYTREYTAWYDSDVFDCGKYYNFTKNGKVKYIAHTPGMSSMEFYTRSGPDSVITNRWTRWDKVVNGYANPNSLRWRYVQYRAEFRYPKPADLPWLEYVNFKFYPLDFTLLLYPDSLKTVSQGEYVEYPLILFYKGDEDDSFYLDLRTPPFSEGWRAELWDTAHIDTIPWNIKLREVIPQGIDTPFIARIYPSADAQVGDTNVTLIYTRTRYCSQDMDDSVILYTVVKPGGVYETWVDQPLSLEASTIANQGWVRFSLPTGETAQLSVFDATGRRVFAREVRGIGNVKWPSADLPRGLYFVRLELDQGALVRKVVLTR